MNFDLQRNYDILQKAKELRELADTLEKIGKVEESGQAECDKFIKENNLEYIRDEVELSFKRGYFSACENTIRENAELKKENAELKRQIEKLKCCENCKHNLNEDEYITNYCDGCFELCKWEL